MGVILVTGANGNVGRHVVGQLEAAGVEVRAFGRPEGDLRSPETLEAALSGVDGVFLIWPFLRTDGAAAVLDAIKKHSRRVVYLSSSGVGEHPDPINRLHGEMESLIEGSGLEWVVLRSNTIASNALGWAEQIRGSGVVRGPEIPATAVVDPRDVAAVAARVLVGQEHGVTHVLTGPEVLSRAEQVYAIGEAIGRPLRFESVPVAEARRRMLADGRPPELVEALLASAESRPRSDVITLTVEEVTGSPARTFRSWAEDHAGSFR